MFFPPCFRPDVEITIWGPASPEASLEDRVARYISAPLSPVEVRELPCSVSFRDTPPSEWQIGSATIRTEAVNHRGPDPRLPDHRGRHDALLHPRPRARPRRQPRRPGAGVDLRLRPGSRRRPADPRLPVHRRGVPRAHRLGPLADRRHADLRQPRRRQAAAALPPRPPALRRLPRRLPRHRPPPLGGVGRRPRPARDGHGGRRARGRARARLGGRHCLK